MEVKVEIQNRGKGFEPVVLDDIQWNTERKGSPGKLTLKVIQDDGLSIEEGNAVSLKVDNESVFYGYIFRIGRDKTKIVSLTCYDQIQYMRKNKDTYNFENTTANRICGMICTDFGIRTGELEETAYVIPNVIYDNKTLLDIVQDALDMTLTNTKKLYVLYDDYGKVTIKQIARMKVGLIIDADTAETFDFESNIDDATYNRIKLMYEDSETHERTVWTANGGTQSQWGTLQYFESISKEEKESAQAKANALLALYNTKTKKLTIQNVLGDLRVRAGSMIMVQLQMGEEKISHWMVVDSCTHTFKQNEHFMTVKVIGGGFVG